MQGASRNAVRIASSHLITSCATLAALLLFVGLGSQVLPNALRGTPLPNANSTLTVAFLLNIAIILFGWRRSKDLKDALEAYEESERVARRNANTDPATGLANRRELLRTLSEARDAKASGTLLLLDLDHFKRVNDLHGHLAGDRLLSVVADVLTRSAPDAACCARFGGDEFAMLLTETSPAAAEKVARGVIAQLAVPVFLGGVQVQVSASIGLAELARNQTEEDILRQSDVALYAAKRSGRNCLAWFDKELERELTERLKLEDDIRTGIQRGEFVPFFQPLIDLQTRDLVGFEALARWRSPTRGFVEAEAFIEVAEATGLVGPLTLAIMDIALKEARAWPAHLKIAVNISPVQFRDRALAEQIMKLLAKTGFPAHRLEVRAEGRSDRIDRRRRERQHHGHPDARQRRDRRRLPAVGDGQGDREVRQRRHAGDRRDAAVLGHPRDPAHRRRRGRALLGLPDVRPAVGP